MKSSVWTKISTVLLLLFVAAVVIGVYLLYLHVNGQALPFESLLSHAEEVSDEEIEAQIAAIGELSTASFEYTDTRAVTNIRQLFGVDIPGTKNNVSITYDGVIKVSYRVEDIRFAVRDGVITVELPEPEITDNYIKLDNMEIQSKNNILNPINLDNLTSFFEGFQDEAVRMAEEMGIWEEAEDRMMLLVEHFLSAFPDHEVEFGTLD